MGWLTRLARLVPLLGGVVSSGRGLALLRSNATALLKVENELPKKPPGARAASSCSAALRYRYGTDDGSWSLKVCGPKASRHMSGPYTGRGNPLNENFQAAGLVRVAVLSCCSNQGSKPGG